MSMIIFAKIRNQIDLHREEMIASIHKKSEELIKQLNDLERACKANIEKVARVDLNLIKSNLADWKVQLRKPRISDAEKN